MQAHIKHRHIYLVNEDVYIAEPANKSRKAVGSEVGIRTVIIPKGELLEFRYFSPAHFRDIYNNYFPIADSQLHKLIPVAEIWEKVGRQNNADLLDILRLSLYDELGENKSIRRTNRLFFDRANEIKEHLEQLQVYLK